MKVIFSCNSFALEKDNRNIQLSAIAVNIYWYQRMIKKSTKFFTNVPTFMVPAIKRATTKVVDFNA